MTLRKMKQVPTGQSWNALAEEKGSTWLHEELKKVDPESAEAIHENNIKRVIRALEFYRLTGKKISEHNEEQRERQSPYNFAYFVLNDEREHLYRRIEQRIDQMMEAGLVEEVRRLKEHGLSSGDGVHERAWI